MKSQKFTPPLKLRVHVDDLTALVRGRNKVVAEMAKKVMKKLREEIQRKASHSQSTRMEKKERAR